MLPILGVIFSIPCFYVITQMPDYAQAARFTLLTYVSPPSLDYAELQTESYLSLRVSILQHLVRHYADEC